MSTHLLNACKYSFNDLIIASKCTDISTQSLISLSQTELNTIVKRLCIYSNWYYDDIIGTDGVVYTSFSKYKK